MISGTHNLRVGRWGLVGISTMAIILVAAATEHDANWERLRAMPTDERTRLLGILRKFDLELTPEQRASVREVDRRLSELSPDRRAQYEAVLRRYHDWLNGLPESRQTELTEKPRAERLALIRKWIAERPVPAGDTQELMSVVEVGELSPFELASAFKIWQSVRDDQKQRLAGLKDHDRRAALFKMGERMKTPIPRETRPDDYDEEKWLGKVHEFLRTTRPILLAEDVVKKKMEEARKRAEWQDEKARKKIEDAMRRFEAGHREVLRRMAINYYVRQTRVSGTVDSERLARFVAVLPDWLRTCFDSLPPDEARRRLTIAYRLAIPPSEEIGSPRTSATKVSKARPSPSKKPGAAARPKQKPAGEADESPSPF
jgi:hypothetical protein